MLISFILSTGGTVLVFMAAVSWAAVSEKIEAHTRNPGRSTRADALIQSGLWLTYFVVGVSCLIVA